MKHLKTTLAVFACVLSVTAAAQVRNLFFNSYDDIVRMDFTIVPPELIPTGVGNGFESIAHAEDAGGNILFFANSNGIYRGNGTLMFGSAGILINPSSTEVAVCPVPGQSQKYYVIYNSEVCSPLYYSIVDLSLMGGAGDVTALNTQIAAGSYSEGMEVIKRPCSEDLALLVYECDAGIKRFDILANGITNETLLAALPIPPPVNPQSSIYQGRGELDYHNGRLGLAFTFTPSVYFADFDPFTFTLSNGNLVNFTPAGNSGMYGLEFSPDGSKAYVSHWYQNFTDNLFQYDFSTGNITGFHLYSNAGDPFYPETGPGQIELGSDGNLYVIMDGGDEIVRIKNAGSPNPQITYIPAGTTLAMGISDPVQSEIFEAPAGHTIILCQGDTAELFAPAIPNSTFLWSTGATDFSISVTEPGTYWVQVSGACEVTDTFHVYDTNFDLGPEQSFCEGDSLLIGAEIPGADYLWSTDETTSHIYLSGGGSYWLEISVPQCQSTISDTVLVKIKGSPAELEMPNVFTPNGDQINDRYIPVTAPLTDRFRLYIYDRWGVKIAETEDYMLGWDGKNGAGDTFPDGVYYWIVEQVSECDDKKVTQHGFFHILATGQ